MECWRKLYFNLCRKYQIWVYVILLWAIYSSVFTPIEFGFFRGLPAHLWWIDQASQLIFMVDIFVNFFVAFKDRHTYKWIMDHRTIALRWELVNTQCVNRFCIYFMDKHASSCAIDDWFCLKRLFECPNSMLNIFINGHLFMCIKDSSVVIAKIIF